VTPLLRKPAGVELLSTADSCWSLSAHADVPRASAPTSSSPAAASSAAADRPFNEAPGAERDPQNSSTSSSRVLLHDVSTCHGQHKASERAHSSRVHLRQIASVYAGNDSKHHQEWRFSGQAGYVRDSQQVRTAEAHQQAPGAEQVCHCLHVQRPVASSKDPCSDGTKYIHGSPAG